MSFFQGSNRFAIEGGTFSSVGRDQHVSIVQCSHHKEKIQTILDEYQDIPTGKVYLKRKIAETEVRRNKKGWRKLNARRTICVAGVHGEDKEEEFMHVQYSGPDAAKACKLDFDTFSSVKNINYVQLLGYSGNMNALPALVFYDALVPVSHILERNNFSPVLLTYFSYQAVVVQGLDDKLLCRELWLNPRTGFLHIGPVVMDSSNVIYELASLSTALVNQAPSLTLQTYSETRVLFEYLNGTLSISDIIRGIRYSNKASLDYPNDEDAKFILSSLPGTIYHQSSREIIAQYPDFREGWYYEFWERVSILPEALQGSASTMDDGSMRFTLKLSDIGVLESFESCYDLCPWESWVGLADSWLSQAHGIFSQLGIGEDGWDEHCTVRQFWVSFKRVEEHGASHTCMDISEETAIYLFIRPIPRPCDDEERWDSWLRDTKYYWSFDSSGVEEMSEHERLNLGLPVFTTEIGLWHTWWDREAYDIFEMIHRSRGFEPTSMELATSLEYPILEVAGREPRFEELNDDYGTSEAMDIDGLTSTFSAFNVDLDSMTIDEMAIPCMSFNEQRCDDAMEID